MSTLEYTVYGIRRGWRLSRTFLFAGAFTAALVAGIFSELGGRFASRTAPILLFGLWAIVFGLRAHSFFLSDPASGAATRGRSELELGLLLVVGTHALVQMAGGFASPMYPIVFLLIAFLVVYTRQWIGFALVATAIAIEFALVYLGPVQPNLSVVLFHSVFIVFFALLNLIFTRTELARLRHATRRDLEQAKARVASDARDFRLSAPARAHTGLLTWQEEQARRSHASVSEVRRSMYHHVDLLKRTMELNTCLILWLSQQSRTLRVLECVSEETDRIISPQGRIQPGEGALGAVVQSQKPVCLKGLQPGYSGLPYYRELTDVTDFLGVPILKKGTLQGVLCADRKGDRPFQKTDEETLSASVESILSIITNEQIFTQLEKAKSEQGKLLAATDRLAQALAEKDVVKAAIESAGEIGSFDIACVALVNSKGQQVVVEAAGRDAEKLVGIAVPDGASLASAALKNRHFLPYRGKFDPDQQIILAEKTQKLFAGMASAIVLPLVGGDEPLGTLALASNQEAAYGEEVRTTLQVLSNQVSVSLQNARMVQRLEEMATTDGLTGLANHRVFQEELEKKFASASRFHRFLSVILCDLDHFKQVNDTYGHPVGDQVIRGLAETLRRNVLRPADLPARYGGEEFVVLCEETTTDGAVRLAERIRKDLEKQTFKTDQGEIRVTLSMGVATYPDHAHTKQDLIERADAALYLAKKGGRNQVRIWSRQ